MAFLDNTGLSHLWDKIKTALSGKLDTTGNAYRAASIPFAQVDDTSTSTVFTATVPGITELRSGVCVFLMNGVVTSASGFTININGLGAKPVYSTLSAASRSTTLFNVAYTLFLVYNEERVSGGCWDAYYGYDSNTNTIGYQLRTTATTMPTLDKFYRYRLLFTAADRNHFVPANTSSSTSADTAKTTTQRPIDPFGAIYYYGHTTAINANANPTTSYFWTQYSFALGYSFNRTGAALTLTNHTPVYIKCAPQSDGSAIIDADNPFVQTLPSTADGKIYIFLGIASSATTVELVPQHPVFCYRNGQIRLWTNADEISSAVTSVNGQTGAVVLDADDVGALPADTPIPAAVTEQTVSGWGFTKNTGTYSKPSEGIPKSDLDVSVKASLDSADSAVQPNTFAVYLDEEPKLLCFLKLNGTTASLNVTFMQFYFNYVSARDCLFVLPIGGTSEAPDVVVMHVARVDIPNTVLSLVGEYGGNRYTVALSAATTSTTPMTGTLVTELIVTQSELPTASTSNPIMDGTAAVGTSDAYAREDHVHPSDTTRLAVNQGAANAGKFMVVGNDGNIAPVTMAAWQGGSY